MNKKQHAKQANKLKSRRVSVPAGAEFYIIKPGEGLPGPLQARLDRMLHNELELERQRLQQQPTASRAMTADEIYEKVAGYVLGSSPDTQNKVLAKLFDRVKRERSRYLMAVEQQLEHIQEQRDHAQQAVFDLDSIKNGLAIIIE